MARFHRWRVVGCAVVLAATSAAGCSSESEHSVDTESSSSAPPETHVVSTTTPRTSTTTASTVASAPDTSFPQFGGTAPCADQEQAGQAPPSAEPFALFGPLAAQPALTIRTAPGTTRELSALRVPGGVLVVWSGVGGSWVAVVNDDGTLRWRKCTAVSVALDPLISAGGTLQLMVQFSDFADAYRLSPVNGLLSDPDFDPEAPPTQTPTLGIASGSRAPGRFSPEGRAADGTRIWLDEDVYTPMYNATNMAFAGDVALFSGCRYNADPASPCDWLTRGYRLSTGEVLWEQPLQAAFVAMGDGHALVWSASSAWMIDVATGAHVGDQEWPAAAFQPGWWMNVEVGDFDTARHGGVVVRRDGGTFSVYYPADAGVAPHEISLP